MHVCVCVVSSGCSQWPELEVIIMYRLVCCDANANAFSVATVLGPALCGSSVATPLQLKAKGYVFGGGRTGLGYPGPCGEQAHTVWLLCIDI